MLETTEPRPALFRRAVFYVAGFDILGPEHYYRMFRRELAKDSALEPRKAVVAALDGSGAVPRWRIETQDGAAPVSVDYFFLSAHREIVNRLYRRNAFVTLWMFARTLHDYARHGVLRRFWCSTPIAAAVFTAPFVVIAAFFLAGAAGALALLDFVAGGIDPWLRYAASGAAGVGAVQVAILLERRLWSNFFLCGMRLGADHALGRSDIFERFVTSWEGEIARLRAVQRYDEVLIVGHSAGAVQAVELASRITSDRQHDAGKVALLTLGSIDMIASYFRRSRYHQALMAAATAPELVWVEYYSPWDWCCRGPKQPVVAAGLDLAGRQASGPEMRMLNLVTMLTPETLRRKPYRLMSRHFDYLMSGDRRTEEDGYFRLICQAKPLARGGGFRPSGGAFSGT